MTNTNPFSLLVIGGQEMKFGVMVVRTEIGHRLIEVDAESAEEATDKALDEAGDYEFSCHDAVYDAESVSKIE
jgi:hypothetical protein